MQFVKSKGGPAGDCCARAFSLATRLAYREVCEHIDTLARAEWRWPGVRSNSLTGVHWQTANRLARKLGGSWVRGRMLLDALPMGRLVAPLPRHYLAVIHGVIHDRAYPGNPTVEGYWRFPG